MYFGFDAIAPLLLLTPKLVLGDVDTADGGRGYFRMKEYVSSLKKNPHQTPSDLLGNGLSLDLSLSLSIYSGLFLYLFSFPHKSTAAKLLPLGPKLEYVVLTKARFTDNTFEPKRHKG